MVPQFHLFTYTTQLEFHHEVSMFTVYFPSWPFQTLNKPVILPRPLFYQEKNNFPIKYCFEVSLSFQISL